MSIFAKIRRFDTFECEKGIEFRKEIITVEHHV